MTFSDIHAGVWILVVNTEQLSGIHCSIKSHVHFKWNYCSIFFHVEIGLHSRTFGEFSMLTGNYVVIIIL